MRLLRRESDDKQQAYDPKAAPVCEHVDLVPRWDRVEDIGHEEHASGYRREACGAEFTPDEAAHLRATESARVQRRISV